MASFSSLPMVDPYKKCVYPNVLPRKLYPFPYLAVDVVY